MYVELARFLRESLEIEGITRSVTTAEMDATINFLSLNASVDSVVELQQVYAPGYPLRTQPGMNVRVNRYVAPHGGPQVRASLEKLLTVDDPWRCHVEFELLHPFMDGNGRTGRAVWALKMLQAGENPFGLSFLHRFYYQTLAHQS